MPRAIPDRWIPYKACGNVIEGTRIICFKVPLRPKVQNDPEIKEKWDVQTLLKRIPNLGLVIDITNTNRYYHPENLQAAGVEHMKMLMLGRVLPPEITVNKFMDAVDDFLKKDKDRLVGVHCTHGLNRTGYMVCRYMRDRLNVPPQKAIERFESARGHKMERKIYIDDILGKSSPQSSSESVGRSPLNICRSPQNNSKASSQNTWSRTCRTRNGCTRSGTKSRRSSEGIDYTFDY